ncbi:hypothetical protein ACEPPN_017809 [Leptodophora sp. 'Broadleaf-Isolate-01']
MAQEATAGGRREYLKTPREVLVQGTKSLKAKETPVQSEDTESSKREPATTGSSVTKRRRAKTPKSRTGCRTCKHDSSANELINTTNETDAARLTLLASLLIFCFESLQGEYANAVDHIKVAMGMMRNRFSTPRRQYSLIRKLAPIPGLEDELVDIFVRIDNTLMVKANATGDRGILDMRYGSEDGYMLSAFRDLGEAKNYLEHHMFCAMPYLARLPDIFMHGVQLSSVEEEETGAQLLEQLRHWNAAFAPLFASARKSPTSQDFIAAASLRCLELVAEISVRKILVPVGIVDEFMKEATEIVDLSRRIVADSGFKKTFVFECGILPALFITVMLCPKRSVRMDIIQVLKLAEGRVEVTWDAIEVARMAKFFMGAEGGDPEPALKLNASMGELFERKDQVQADSYSRGLDLAESELRATS